MIRTASIAFAFVASCYIATTIGDRRFHGETETLIRALVDDEADSAAAGQKEIDQDIPPAILKYLGSALPDDALQGKVPRYARVSQRGLIAMSEGNWTDFEATKVVALPPRLQRGYVWTCILNFYGIKVYIRDSLVNGKGESYGSLFGLISLGRFYAEPAVTLSSLLRYLGESVWTPQAFLPSNGCSWTPTETLEGKNAFMATIHDAYCGETARTIFSFDAETGLPDRMVIPQRPRMVGKVMVPSDMGGICSEPKSFSGVVVPSYQEAWWVVEEGRKLEMWKARIVDIQWGF